MFYETSITLIPKPNKDKKHKKVKLQTLNTDAIILNKILTNKIQRKENTSTSGWDYSRITKFFKKLNHRIKGKSLGASLVAQWLRICLPMQRTWVRTLVWEDPTCCALWSLCATTTEATCHNYGACALEPASHNY